MALFQIIHDGFAVLRSKGVYRQAPLYHRDGQLYAKWGSGFIGLRRDGGTTLPNVSAEDLEGPVIVYDEMGRAYLRGYLPKRGVAA